MTELLEHRFVELLDATPDALVCVAADGRIVLVNAQAERLFGYRREEMVSQQVDMLVPEALRAAHRAHRSGYAARPRRRPMGIGLELAGRRRDGGSFPAEISLAFLDTADGPLAVAAVRDISMRKNAAAEKDRLRAEADLLRREQERQNAQRLESLGRLAGQLGHDFNNLLNVITSYAGFISEAAQGRRDIDGWAEVRDDVRRIEQAAGRAAGLTRQLIVFARNEVIQPRPVDLNALIAGLEQQLRRTAGERTELRVVLARDLDAVLADPGQIEQVLVNLTLNARDAMPSGGTLTIETGVVEADEAYSAGRDGLPVGRYVVVAVSDTGTGMPREVLGQAFDPFFSTRPPGEGAGLGLAAVYSIVKRTRGDVRIYSEPGLGTTVRVLLPVTRPRPGAVLPAQRGSQRGPQDGSLGGRGEVILVVDDEEAMRTVTDRLLSRSGYQVLVAAGGAEAIEIAAAYSGRISALVTDVVMPGMHGPEVAERIRSARPEIRVLYMSGYTRGMLGSQEVLDPAVALIEKPFTAAALLGAVHGLLAGQGRPLSRPAGRPD